MHYTVRLAIERSGQCCILLNAWANSPEIITCSSTATVRWYKKNNGFIEALVSENKPQTTIIHGVWVRKKKGEQVSLSIVQNNEKINDKNTKLECLVITHGLLSHGKHSLLYQSRMAQNNTQLLQFLASFYLNNNHKTWQLGSRYFRQLHA